MITKVQALNGECYAITMNPHDDIIDILKLADAILDLLKLRLASTDCYSDNTYLLCDLLQQMLPSDEQHGKILEYEKINKRANKFA